MKCLVRDFLPAVLGDVRGPLDAVVAHLADEVEQVLRGEGRRAHHQLVQDAPEGPLRAERGFQCCWHWKQSAEQKQNKCLSIC